MMRNRWSASSNRNTKNWYEEEEEVNKMEKNTNTKDQARKFVEMVAKKQGWHLNPDAQFIVANRIWKNSAIAIADYI